MDSNSIFTLEPSSILGYFCDFSFLLLRLWRTLINHLMAETLNCEMTLASSSFRLIFRLWTKLYLEMWKKYTHMMVHTVSSTPWARHYCVWAEDSKAFHQIPLNVQKVVVEGYQGELQPAPKTCLLWDGNSGDHSSNSRQLIITTAITTSLAYKFWNVLIGISLKLPFSATSFHNSN